MSPILNWKRRKYRGSNPHRSHFHISFTTLGDEDGSWFNLEGDNNERIEKDGGNVGEDIRRDGTIDIPPVGLQPDYILNAALVSVLPSVINWLNPNYERYGRVK